MKKLNNEECCSGKNSEGQYKIESVVSVDDRGQMVLPKEVRQRMNIQPGDKFAVVVLEKDGIPCCINLVKANDFSSMLKTMLDPAVTKSEF